MFKSLRNKKNKKGFTLIELIVVIAILAILALILVPTISNYVSEATDSKNFANARSVLSEVNAYAAMNSDETGDCTGYSAEGLTFTCAWGDGVVSSFSATSTGSNPKTYSLNTTTGQLSD